jgi:hypothetical protein
VLLASFSGEGVTTRILVLHKEITYNTTELKKKYWTIIILYTLFPYLAIYPLSPSQYTKRASLALKQEPSQTRVSESAALRLRIRLPPTPANIPGVTWVLPLPNLHNPIESKEKLSRLSEPRHTNATTPSPQAQRRSHQTNQTHSHRSNHACHPQNPCQTLSQRLVNPPYLSRPAHRLLVRDNCRESRGLKSRRVRGMEN